MNNTEKVTLFGEASAEYKRFRPEYPSSLFKIILKNVKKPYLKALDIGAGTGLSTKILSDIFETVVAIEPDKKMTARAGFGENVQVINDCTENVDFDNDPFDLITAGNSFYWIDAETVLEKMHGWLKPDGVIAAYRYNMPLTDNEEINKIIISESERNWDKFRHERVKDTDYTYRSIKSSPLFYNVRRMSIENIEILTPEELVGFFSSTSYMSAYIRSLDNREEYLNRFLNKIKEASNSTMINVDFSLELVMGKR